MTDKGGNLEIHSSVDWQPVQVVIDLMCRLPLLSTGTTLPSRHSALMSTVGQHQNMWPDDRRAHM